MNIEKLKEFADTIKHCGDYGGLWLKNNDIIWVAGDADFDEDEEHAGICSSVKYIEEGFYKLGADKVDIECEWEPDETDGWNFLGRFGIDNWKEASKFWENNNSHN